MSVLSSDEPSDFAKAISSLHLEVRPGVYVTGGGVTNIKRDNRITISWNIKDIDIDIEYILEDPNVTRAKQISRWDYKVFMVRDFDDEIEQEPGDFDIIDIHVEFRDMHELLG